MNSIELAKKVQRKTALWPSDFERKKAIAAIVAGNGTDNDRLLMTTTARRYNKTVPAWQRIDIA